MYHHAEQTDGFRPTNHHQGAYPDAGGHRQPYHHPHTSLGATGHWIHLLTVAAPLVIGEVFKDADKRWKAMRWVSVGAGVASEAAWTLRIARERKRDEEHHAELQACQEQRCR